MYPQQQAIAITTRYHWLTFVLALFKPQLAVNGHQVLSTWGRTVVPVPPGQHHVHAHVPYLIPSRIGNADTMVTVHPGQVVELEYRAPIIGWLDGSLGPAPQRWRGMAAGVAVSVIPLVVLLCVCAGIGTALIAQDDDEPIARPALPVPTPTVETLEPVPTRPTPTRERTTPSGDKPTLRAVPAEKVVGATFAAGEDTYTMDFTGWPFAFRTPPTWGCIGGKSDLPDSKAWVCIDERNSRNGQRVQIMIRPCPDGCTPATRDRMSAEWFDPGAKVREHSDMTWYVETARDDRGRYMLDLSHFFPDGNRTWQVGVGSFSPPAERADTQKIVNDVLTQAG